jgi:hypothetical protein
MRRFTKWFYLLLLSTALLMPHYANAARGIAIKPVSPSGAKVKGNQWLFVIGIDTYINWPRLNTAVSDAKSVREVLLSRYYFDKDHLIELYDEQATRRNILSKLRFLAKKAHKDDSLVIFYAGHGHLSITKAGSWIPVGSGVEDTSAWITNHDIKNYLRVDAIKAKHILLISDSCFSGNFFRGHRGKLPEVTDTVIKKAYKLTSRQAITSGGLEPVGDEGFGENSVFSHFLVKTLKENQKPFLVPSSFFPDIKAGVAENAEQFPRFGSLKDTGGQQGGEIILFLKQNSRLKDLSVEAAKRQKELQRLKEMEVSAEKARKKESAEIAKQEKELAELDSKIATMRKRMNTPSAQGGDDLDAMLTMVNQKEQQQKRIDELKRQRKAEEDRRRAEIEHLKAEKRKKRIAAIKEDIRKYEKIVSSQFGKDMKESAWKSLTAKYPEEADGLEIGDTDGLLFGNVIARDGTLVAYATGVVYDKNTSLEWFVGPDRDTTWDEAKSWVANLTVGGGGWRMPTRKELETLYQEGAGTRNMTPLLETTGWWVWSGETKGSSSAWYFYFYDGNEDWTYRSGSNGSRGFAVRSRR